MSDRCGFKFSNGARCQLAKGHGANHYWTDVVVAKSPETPAPRTFTAEEVEPLVEALKAARVFVRGKHSTLSYGPNMLVKQIDSALTIWDAKLSAPAKDGL